MDRFVHDLFAKRGSVREEALSSIVDGLQVKYRFWFAEKYFATLLYRCLNSFKKGSCTEIVSASHALGLLSITIGCGDNAHELYRESLLLISDALKYSNESLLLSVIDCLAIATFVGANDFEETKVSMQIIWHFICSNPGENVAEKKHPASILSAAISAWSFLLTTVDGWCLNQNYWKGALSYFLDLLEVDDQSVCIAAAEAIGLIYEVGSLEKFACDTANDEICSEEKAKNISVQHSYVQELQQIISNHAKRLLRQTSLQSAATNILNGWNSFSLSVLEILEGGCFHETTMKIGKHSLQLHSLSQSLQVNFIKRFLGCGFVRHMLENEFLHDVFNFTPRKQMSGNELYSSGK